jgi:hypothetical protein
VLVEADFELRECLEDSLRTLRLWAAEKRLALRCHVGTDLPVFLSGTRGGCGK